MKNKIFSSLLLTAAVSMLTLTFGAGLTFAAHPDIPLYTYEEVGMQFGMPNNMMPVQFQNATDPMAQGFMQAMPYSPKMTCGNCHNGTTTSWDGQVTDLPADMVSYDDMTTQTFHAELGAQSWKHGTETSQPGKPWSRTTGMWGKW